MRTIGRWGGVVGIALTGGCTWIPFDGPLGGGGRPDEPEDTAEPDPADTDTAETEPSVTGDTGTGSNIVDGVFDLALSRALILGAEPGDFTGVALATGELTGDGVADLVLGS